MSPPLDEINLRLFWFIFQKTFCCLVELKEAISRRLKIIRLLVTEKGKPYPVTDASEFDLAVKPKHPFWHCPLRSVALVVSESLESIGTLASLLSKLIIGPLNKGEVA